MKQYTHELTLRLTDTHIKKLREIAKRKEETIAHIIRELITKSK